MEVHLTCSNKIRSSTGTRKRGHQWWKREVFHIQRSGMTTLCGVDCSEWLRMDPREVAEAKADRSCCAKCAARL